MHTAIAFVADSQSAIEHRSRPKLGELSGINRISKHYARQRFLSRDHITVHGVSVIKCMLVRFGYSCVLRSAGSSDRMVIR